MENLINETVILDNDQMLIIKGGDGEDDSSTIPPNSGN